MNEEARPTLEEWRRLYTAAMSYRDMAPWDWMDDNSIFGVMNPEDGEIGYCCVMGSLGEFFALVVYEGREGWDGFMKIITGEVDEHDPDVVLLYQKAIMVSFEDREDLTPEDRKVIKELGLKLRGRNAWPMFRHYLPKYYPWYLTGAQARFLTLALEQSQAVLPRCLDNPQFLPPLEAEKLLVRVPAGPNGRDEWRDEFLPPPAPLERKPPRIHLDDLRLERIRRNAKRSGAAWEVGYCLAPIPLQDRQGERPFLGRLLMVVEGKNGLILTGRVEGPPDEEGKLLGHLLEFMERTGVFPAQIHIANQGAEDILASVARKLGIALKRKKRLPNFDMAFRSMVEDFRR